MSNDQMKHDAMEALYHWQYSNTECFHDHLFDLIVKADLNNRRKLLIAFPFEVLAFEEWNAAGDYGNDAFRKYGLMKYG